MTTELQKILTNIVQVTKDENSMFRGTFAVEFATKEFLKLISEDIQAGISSDDIKNYCSENGLNNEDSTEIGLVFDVIRFVVK